MHLRAVSQNIALWNEVFREAAHFINLLHLGNDTVEKLAYLPLRPSAEANSAGGHQFAEVHGHHDVGGAGIRQDEPGVLGGDVHLRKLGVNLAGFPYDIVEDFSGIVLVVDCSRTDCALRPGFDISLGLLGKAGYAMPHQLMTACARNSLDGESEGDMFKNAVMAGVDDLVQKAGHLLESYLVGEDVRGRIGGIAGSRRSIYGLEGFGRMVNQHDFHFKPKICAGTKIANKKTAPMGCGLIKGFRGKLLLALDDFAGLVFDSVFAAEFLDASGCIDHLLLTGEEGMACGADVQLDFLFGRSDSP